MKQRTTRCCCGETTMTVEGEPVLVLRCHCDYCQRRTGNVAQTSAWFTDAQVVDRAGEVTAVDYGDTDMPINYMFCSRCGSTVFWTFDRIPGIWGLAVGNFFDADFPMPTMEIHTTHRHPWIVPVPDATQFEAFPAAEDWLADPKVAAVMLGRADEAE